MELTVQLTDPKEKNTLQRSQKMLLWLAMISMTMVFAALTSAYIVSSSSETWVAFELPAIFYYSTAAIIVSSFSLALAVKAARNNNFGMVRAGMLITIVLGLVFSWLQVKAWGELVEMNIFFAGSSSASGPYLYFITGLHLAHLFFGMIALIVSTIKSFGNKYHSDNIHGLRMTATFWHFLDFLWVYLFLFLLLFR